MERVCLYQNQITDTVNAVGEKVHILIPVAKKLKQQCIELSKKVLSTLKTNGLEEDAWFGLTYEPEDGVHSLPLEKLPHVSVDTPSKEFARIMEESQKRYEEFKEAFSHFGLKLHSKRLGFLETVEKFFTNNHEDSGVSQDLAPPELSNWRKICRSVFGW